MQIQFQNIMGRLEEVLLEKNGKKKILNREMAIELGLTPDYYAVIKKRGKVPYISLAFFAQREQLNLNWLLLGTPPKYICQEKQKSA